MLLIRFLTCVLLFLVATTPIQVRADKVAIRAPVWCSEGEAPSCGEDISLDEAKAYRTLESGVSKTLTDHHVCEKFATHSGLYYWAPLEQFSDGEAMVIVSATAWWAVPTL